ncbi:MAG TPA: hypothetical protein VMT99_00825 [Candidatus Paceibacterota bacterium]|nr:hypothetical protein [Candidatus Paceibacterota bacterium]
MKKIIADKSEGIAEVIDKILNEPENEVVLVIPKNSALGKSVRNFTLLRRESDAAGKSVVIESVDETILAYAKQADIEASHPLWKSVRGSGGFSDIVPKDEGAHEPKAKKSRAKKAETKLEIVEIEESSGGAGAGDDDEAGGGRDETADEAEDALQPETEEEAEIEESIEENRFFKKISLPARLRRMRSEGGEDDGGNGSDSDAEDGDDDAAPRRISAKVWWTLAAVVIALAAVGYILTAYFDRADIAINFKQTPWSYQGSFIADKNASAFTSSGGTVVIPATVFTSPKNITENFPASSQQNVNLKSTGVITIYNAYNSSPQELVATTRFLTPDGKIFRLVNNVTVPGAQVANGTITPSSVTAAIVADQPGLSYNMGPVAHLTIPGFQKDAGRYQGFYGAIATSTAGGFTGTKAVPTAADITAAKASTTAILQASLAGGFTNAYPQNFKILDGATTYQVSKLIVGTTTDANGNFTVFGQATMVAVGFDENALKAYLLSLAQATEASSTFSSVTIDYSGVQANFTTGQVKFDAAVQANLEPSFSADDFSSTIQGQSIASARNEILNLPNLADGKISVWPLWLMSIPANPGKVHITVH